MDGNPRRNRECGERKDVPTKVGNNLTQLFKRSGGIATTTELLHMGFKY
jgi:hypothetical protein